MFSFRTPIIFASTVIGSGWALSRIRQTAEPDELYEQIDHPDHSPYHIMLDNKEDLVYTAKIRVGEQKVDLVPDTGSFEAVIFSDKCEACGKQDTLYHSKNSSTREPADLTAEFFYGSGSVKTQEVFETFGVGGYEVPRQVFWEVYEANMPVLENSMLAGIFGLGGYWSNIKMANMSYDSVKRMMDDGQNSSSMDDALDNARKRAEFAKKETLWVMSSLTRTFSICFGKHPGSQGVLKFNDGERIKYFNRHVDVVGDIYWSAKLKSVKLIGKHPDIPNKIWVGCGSQDEECSAILDTGTSLISAPAEEYNKIVGAIESYFDNTTNGCQDLSGLPQLTFKFGDEEFSLPPHAYVGEIDDSFPEELVDHMPHLKAFQAKHKSRSWGASYQNTFCSPLIMSQASTPGMWILGMPFFRKYNVMFHLSDDSKSTRKMHFADATTLGGDHCIFGKPPKTSEFQAANVDVEEDEEQVQTMRVNGHHILLPRRLATENFAS